MGIIKDDVTAEIVGDLMLILIAFGGAGIIGAISTFIITDMGLLNLDIVKSSFLCAFLGLIAALISIAHINFIAFKNKKKKLNQNEK